VANAALRLKPSPEMVQELLKQFAAKAGKAPGAMPAGPLAAPGNGFPGSGSNGAHKRPKDMGMLWYLDGSGTPKAIRVKTGISDGQLTEIRSDEIKDGMEIIKSITLSAAEQAAAQGPPRMRLL
jgi:hypothetical protein